MWVVCKHPGGACNEYVRLSVYFQPCSETSSVLIIRPTAPRYGSLVIIFVTSRAREAGLPHARTPCRPWRWAVLDDHLPPMCSISLSLAARVKGLRWNRPRRLRRGRWASSIRSNGAAIWHPPRPHADHGAWTRRGFAG